MFGSNEIVGQKFFKDSPEDSLLVTSIFGPTIQGEGPLQGQPSLFIRLAKCNLNCSFCDTFFDQGDWLTFLEIAFKLQELMSDKEYNLIITGGEPSLQKENLIKFLSLYHHNFKSIQIESNGILDFSYEEEDGYNFCLDEQLLLIVSPKCSEKSGRYLKPNENTLRMAEALKFVISADPESPYHTIPDWAFEWKEKKAEEGFYQIYCSPMNIYNHEPIAAKKAQLDHKLTLEERSSLNEVISFWEPGLLNMEQNQKNHEYAAKFCIENNCFLTLQQQLYVSVA